MKATVTVDREDDLSLIRMANYIQDLGVPDALTGFDPPTGDS